MADYSLISVITPSYNCGTYISRLLDSILLQTYPRIEMFVCDDGSTDSTRQVIESYIPKFSNRNYKLNYLYQENQGQSAAINTLLKLVKGEYLVWPDADDFYASSNAIQEMYSSLCDTDDCISAVQTNFKYVEEKNLRAYKMQKLFMPENDFEACLLANKFHFCPGKFMAKMSIIDAAIENREIFVQKDAGQNWQLMLPILYKHKCLIIDKPLYFVLERKNSHSRSIFTLESRLSRIQTYENTINATLDLMKNIENSERENYKRLIKEKYINERLNLAVDFIDKKYIAMYRQQKIEYMGKLSAKEKLKCAFPFLYWLSRIPMKILRRIKMFLKCWGSR